MAFSDGGVLIEKAPSALDRLVLDVTGILDRVGVEYAVVSGYVAVLFGRARATEAIDVIAAPVDADTCDRLVEELRAAGFWGSAMPLDDAHETLADGLPVRIAREGDLAPTVVLQFATDEADCVSLSNAVPVTLAEETLRVGSLEFQIASKLAMGSETDFEDALYLHEVLAGALDTAALETYVDRLDVREQYDRLANE